ncbi:Ser/Thr protein kinase RdoA involved in Cpx stress response, MazF antagonist [Ectothiorhodosinus mongolicus]|uniref:Ser/Thr protein kinase RdoA involved in Cpx stress response, MazF antagonist n=1 Tax=Ectothiorhodosinus mongolicus TaxID=233100 RepID=A0A1R3W5D9_9GAMM|nr:phosphotransferase [Ectothiorhodosinus mongolicus]SIT72994.1 Ser/Thr protein kinase RdoA involved in Cpx stress response, MazF antagonist [Ectothiorhodosinus mongolicus]
MTGLYQDAFLRELQEGVTTIMGGWGIPADAQIQLLEISENATFLASAPGDGQRWVLRVYRPGYRSIPEIRSELHWIQLLRAEEIIRTPAVLPSMDGGYDHLSFLSSSAGPLAVACFEYVYGRAPTLEDDQVALLRQIGGISARLQEHVRRWQPPPGFTRKLWDFQTMLGRQAYWGDWRCALGLDARGKRLLEEAVLWIFDRIQRYGQSSDRFGLIHGDLRAANLLMDAEGLQVIDFDDSGLSWFGMDFAGAISFIETEVDIPLLQEAFLDGYRQIRQLQREDVYMLPVFVLARRLQLTAWVASHHETPTAKALGEQFTQGTIYLADSLMAHRS